MAWKSDVQLTERKRRLVAEGALLRIGIIEGRRTLRANLTAASLAKGALHRIVSAVSLGAGGNLRSLLIGGVLSRPYLRKPLFYVAAAAALAYYLTRKRACDVTAVSIDE